MARHLACLQVKHTLLIFTARVLWKNLSHIKYWNPLDNAVTFGVRDGLKRKLVDLEQRSYIV